MADLQEILRSWAAGREGVSQLQITDLEYDFDEGWPPDVTPGEPEVVIQYKVLRHVIYKRPVDELGDFIQELAGVIAKKPATSVEPADEIREALERLVGALERSTGKNMLSQNVKAALNHAKAVLDG